MATCLQRSMLNLLASYLDKFIKFGSKATQKRCANDYLFLGANMIKVNRLEEAEKLYLGLIKRNPENHMYYHQLEVAKGATTIEEKLEIYAEMSEKYPKAQAPQRLALEIAQVHKKVFLTFPACF